MNLSDLFPDEDFRFKMRLDREDPAAFFRPSAARDCVLSERRRWLGEDPQAYSGLLPEGAALLEETIRLARTWGSISIAEGDALAQFNDPLGRCRLLGQVWEPDFLLLKPGPDGRFHLLGGCVCFPSSWSLAEKMGRPLELIHGPVPGLNEQQGNAIHSFLRKLRPGIAWTRQNWGLSRSPELNQHPSRPTPRLDATVRSVEVWLRVEHQALVALPESGGILFGIRVSVHPLEEVKGDAQAVAGLRRALRTMPEEVARYKGLATARQTILSHLQAWSLSPNAGD